MAGLPIRLIRRDGQTIPLDCTGYQMNVKRGIMTLAAPISAERVGSDFNIVNTGIRLEVTLLDDDCTGVDQSDTQASSYLDFSATMHTEIQAEAKRMMTLDGGDETPTTLDGAAFTITVLGGHTLKVTLDNTEAEGTNVYSPNGELSVGISNTTSKGHNIAIAIKNAINHTSTRMNNNTAPSAHMTVSVTKGSQDVEANETSRIKFLMVTAGSTGNISDMTWDWSDDVALPYWIPWSSGRGQSCFSAGDKMQNLIGSVANNTILGAMGTIASYKQTSLIGPVNTEWSQDTSDPDFISDYIVGLQLPYNSFIGVPEVDLENIGSQPQGYAAKNFYFGTGISNTRKGALTNDLPASTVFDISNKYTGIRGTVVNVDFQYAAGSTIYSCNIDFQPLDFMWGA